VLLAPAVALGMNRGARSVASTVNAFICGRGAREKTIAQLKGEFALDVLPTEFLLVTRAGRLVRIGGGGYLVDMAEPFSRQ
jgi:hypothetical protein